MVAKPLLKPFFAEAQMVKPILTIRTIAAVEAQIITPTRQPLRLSRLAFFRSLRHFVAVTLGASGDMDGESNGAVPNLRLQRMVKQGHICSWRRFTYPGVSVISESSVVDGVRACWSICDG